MKNVLKMYLWKDYFAAIKLLPEILIQIGPAVWSVESKQTHRK
jgi:hypothetical protein